MTDRSDRSAVGRRVARRAKRAVAALRQTINVRGVGSMHVYAAPGRRAVVTIEGWAQVPGDEVLDVIVEIDGSRVARARADRPSPDLEAVRGAGGASAGWRAMATVEPDGPPIEVVASLRTVAGLTEEIGRSTVPRPGRRTTSDAAAPVVPATTNDEIPMTIGGVIDEPADGFDPDQLVAVSGFVLSEPVIDRIEIHSGDDFVGLARPLAFPHGGVQDIPGAFDQRSLTGFTFVAEPGQLRQSLTARVITPLADVDIAGPTPRPDVPGSKPQAAVRPEGLDRVLARSQQACDASGATSTASVRLLVVTHHLGIGGAQLYLQDLLRGLLDEPAFSCTVAAPIWGELALELEALGARVELFGNWATRAFDYEAQVAAIGRIAAEMDANIALVNTLGAFVGIDVATRRGVPSIWAVHESFTFDAFFHEAYTEPVEGHVRERLLHALASADRVVFEAESTRQLHAPHTPLERSVARPYGIDLDAIDAYCREVDKSTSRDELGIAADDLLLACVGTVEPRKAQAMLVDAFRRIDTRGVPAKLALVGWSPNAYGNALASLVDELGMTDQVILHPVSSDIWTWYRATDALVLLSDIESLPRTVMEAMAFGDPVLATSAFGLPEVVTDGVHGLLSTPRDLAACADMLQRFVDLDPDERRSMGAAAKALAEERFGMGPFIASYRDDLRRLLASDD